jgi:hypothetical protein
MALFKATEKPTSFALIDIDSTSVGAALAHIDAKNAAVLYYSVREKIEAKGHETPVDAMIRTIGEVGHELTVSGAPVLRQETGSGSVDKIAVSVGAPWQKTKIRIEALSEKKPFLFTKAVVSEILSKDTVVPDGYTKSNESILATLLNGYETEKPYGKKVTRADIVVLSSLIEKNTSERIEKSLREAYHTHSLTLHAFDSVAYTAFRELYPHEKDFLILDVSGEATDIAFVKRGLLVNITTIPHGINDLVRGVMSSSVSLAQLGLARESIQAVGNKEHTTPAVGFRDIEKSWLDLIVEALQDASSKQALPHTIFLLAEPESIGYVQKLLDSTNVHSLWLTDDPLRIISVAPSHFSKVVKVRGDAEPDVFLALLALYSKHELLP